MPLPNSRRNIRMQNIARYRISGRLQDKQIAELVGMTPQGLQLVLASPEYIELENALLEGRVSQMDEALAGDVEELRNSFRVAVPVAARTLLEIVQQRRDLRASLAAAKEILDRDPDHIFTPARVTQAPGHEQGQIPGQAFNPAQASTIVASMTADASKVVVQMATPTPPSPAPLPPTPPSTIEGGK